MYKRQILANLSSLLNLNVVTSRMRTLLTTPAMDGDGKTVPKMCIRDRAKVLTQSDDCVVVDYGCKGRGIVKNYNLFEDVYKRQVQETPSCQGAIHSSE